MNTLPLAPAHATMSRGTGVSSVVAPGRAATVAFALVAALAAFLTMREQFAAVWRTGVFFDTDDTMHLVQVRAWLAGQSWFDMTVPRMDPPVGTLMHWSRVADVPLAAFVRLFGLVMADDLAERVMRLAYPFALSVGFYLAMARLAGLLLGPDARVPAMIATLLSGQGIAEFAPGRIDHHGPQILILVVMLGSAVAALDRRRAWQAALVGGLSGLSLSINLEDLPFIAVLGCGLVMAWMVRGEAMRQALAAYACGLAVGLPVCFAASVAPAFYAAPVCDAFGAAHLGAGVIAAAGLGAAALAGPRLRSGLQRWLAAAAVAVCAVVFVALFYPACLHDPFAAVDPLVRELWLAGVEESQPFPTLLRHDPGTALPLLVPVVLGLGACLIAARCAPAPRRAAFALVTAVVATGLALSFWQIRVFSSITAIACCGGVFVAMAVRRHWHARGRDVLASLSLATLLPFTATAVTVVSPPVAAAAGSGGSTTAAACFDPAAFRPLAGLHGSVVAPVDLGSYLLVHTDLSVFAAAFHRDNDGNRLAFDIMLAEPAQAGRQAVRRGVGFVLTCDGLSDTRGLAARAPGSLAAALVAGRLPPWLEPVALTPTPLRLYRVRPERV